MIYLIPCPISEDAIHTLSAETNHVIRQCDVFFVENERSARRFLKKVWKEIDIDSYQWFNTDQDDHKDRFREKLKEGKNIAIISEAGCPGVADPGQDLVAIAQEMNIPVHPLAGPSSILMALMASGMNGQHFTFHGYLPIDNNARVKTLKEIENDALRKNSCHIFIETPYRNNQMFQSITQICRNETRLCIAANISSAEESIKTMTVQQWKNNKPELHKKTVIFILGK
ncbi:MAG: SAM-dependent methyltransferase [Chitinophagaceae bacterium]